MVNGPGSVAGSHRQPRSGSAWLNQCTSGERSASQSAKDIGESGQFGSKCVIDQRGAVIPIYRQQLHLGNAARLGLVIRHLRITCRMLFYGPLVLHHSTKVLKVAAPVQTNPPVRNQEARPNR